MLKDVNTNPAKTNIPFLPLLSIHCVLMSPRPLIPSRITGTLPLLPIHCTLVSPRPLIPSRTMGTLPLLPIHCVLISLDPKSRPIWVETKVKTVLIDVREKEIQYLWSGWPCYSATAWCPDVTLRDIRT